MAEELKIIKDITISNNKSASEITSGLVKVGNGTMKGGIIKALEYGRLYGQKEMYGYAIKKGRIEGGIIGALIAGTIGVGIGIGIYIHQEKEKLKLLNEIEKLKIQQQIMLNELQGG